MSGYFESYMSGKIAQAYEVLLGRFPETERIEKLSLTDAPPDILCDLRFTPQQRLIARELRELFSGSDGHKIAALTRLAKESIVITQTRSTHGDTQYGIDRDGPYQLFFPKKLPLIRKKRPVLCRISFEELCFSTERPKEVYLAVYRFLRIRVAEVLGE